MNQETEAWNTIADCVDAYLQEIQSKNALPSIEHFLPIEKGPTRNLIIIELAKIEMEQLVLSGVLTNVQEYLARFPELAECTGGVPLDLVFEEIRLRRNDEPLLPDKYKKLFPQHALAIQRFFDQSTVLSGSESRSRNVVKSMFDVGDSFGDFQILKLLGTGAFAKVFLANQTTMQRLVALKVSADSGDEAKTLAQLDHPNVIRVFDVRCVQEQKLRLLSMQYVPGGTLADVIWNARSNQGNLSGKVILRAVDAALLSAGMPSPEESIRRTRMGKSNWLEAVCEIGIQLADALDYAHRLKVLHRDVKPANVLLTAECICKLADFNISYSEAILGTNPSSYFGGSLTYMSPEQLEAATWSGSFQIEQLDERSDVFSLAFVLWELLNLQRPWPNDELKMDWNATIEELVRRRRCEEPMIGKDLQRSQSASRVIQCLREALVYNREERTPNAATLGAQLRLCLSPKAWRMLHPESGIWTRLSCNYPTLIALAAIFVPNGLAGAFNYNYNLAWLSARHPDAHQILIEVSVLLNVVSFGMGFVFFYLAVRPVTREVARRSRGDRSKTSPFVQKALLSGHTAAVFGLSLWLVAGILFPLLLASRMEVFAFQDAVHFFLSLAICGAIAVSYPFLGMSLLAIQSWLGVLEGSDMRDTDFKEKGIALMRWCDRYLLAATAVPLAGLAMLLTQQSPVRPALTILVAASGLGLFIAFRVHQVIQESIAALTPVLAPHLAGQSEQ